MSPVAVVTDSTADLGDLATQAHISVVPLTVSFGSQHFRDGVDLSREDFYQRLAASSHTPATAQPAPSAFAELYEGLLAAGATGIMSLHCSGALSGTYNSAVRAAKDVDPNRIAVIDTRSVSLGLGLLALQAADDASHGLPLASIEQRVRDDSPKLELYATIPSLTYLARGGRIGQLQSLLGNVLRIVPIITLKDGEVAEHSKVRTFARSVDQMVQIVTSRIPRPGHAKVAVLHSVAADLAESVARRIQTAVAPALLISECVGPTVGTHTGPGAVGVVFIP
ncbi:MAG TPA: DegV family protein [Candidatus Eremiobacteraceae bacterium]|nr:DegV family protein [Candidatus Eremiobacteraceae bacterium]